MSIFDFFFGKVKSLKIVKTSKIFSVRRHAWPTKIVKNFGHATKGMKQSRLFQSSFRNMLWRGRTRESVERKQGEETESTVFNHIGQIAFLSDCSCFSLPTILSKPVSEKITRLEYPLTNQIILAWFLYILPSHPSEHPGIMSIYYMCVWRKHNWQDLWCQRGVHGFNLRFDLTWLDSIFFTTPL